MHTYIPTVGLEIHAELKTATKMFCCSKNDPDEAKPNVNICPVCLAHPGSLPVINKEAVKQVLRVGTALGGTLADYTEFDRKNYFYPDLPKGYQLSQYEFPLVSGGSLSDVAITRVHLEEDTASSIHDEETGATLIDYNRSGVPLMELVTEPVIKNAEKAGEFARALQLLLRYLGASEANMEKGQMRVEANVSVARDGDSTLGTKVEIKNLNSFRAMERAVAYEIERQSALLEEGKAVVQETRGWNEQKQETFSQRVKEVAADYRYFPDPDLPSLRLSKISDFSAEALRKGMPELPRERQERYVALGIKNEDAQQYVSNPVLGDFFDSVVKALPEGEKNVLSVASNYIANDLANLLRGKSDDTTTLALSPEYFAKLILLVVSNKVSSRGAKDVLAEMFASNRAPEKIAQEKGLYQESSEETLLPAIQEVLRQNLQVVDDYRNGKQAALKFLVGQGMKATKGAGNPEVILRLLVSEIGKL